MERRKFINNLMLASFSLANVPSLDVFIADEIKRDRKPICDISDELRTRFGILLKWLNDTGWIGYLSHLHGFSISPSTENTELIATQIINVKKEKGFEDFAGDKLIEPGYPALSLLYHALASPRVVPPGFTMGQFPSLDYLDTLENVIYGLQYFEKEELASLVLAVFAYEYRPAFKTPGYKHADLVFSRTGVARIGTEEMNYDAVARCFSNQPGDESKIKDIATTPARYGTFLAKIVRGEKEITLLNGAKDRKDDNRSFLLPVRKVFQDDLLIDINDFGYREYHLNEKLHTLARQTSGGSRGKIEDLDSFDISQPPFRIDSNNTTDLVYRQKVGSSVLIASAKGDLIRPALQNGKRVCLNVRRKNDAYFSAFVTAPPVEDIELLGFDRRTGRFDRTPNEYDRPRNVPWYINAKYKLDPGSNEFVHLLGDEARHPSSFDKSYRAGLFTDSICDGYVLADTSGWKSNRIDDFVFRNCLPAFSIITAPDFFPFIDSNVFNEYDLSVTQNRTNFYEGGVYSLSAERMKPNISLINQLTDSPAFKISNTGATLETFTSVLTAYRKMPDVSTTLFSDVRNQDYEVASYLPDSCSGIFAPGWDITYADDGQKKIGDIYLSTRGLGSPFLEDMKLCAAMNGMWPASSPDASRTYQASFYSNSRNPTAVPLTDPEIGLNTLSPACAVLKLPETHGWDGEQGPFLQNVEADFWVNYTDLASADYVENVLQHKMDMSLTRNLSGKEMLLRMDALRRCIHTLPESSFIDTGNADDSIGKNVGSTNYWLISFEKVVDWTQGAKGYGIPKDLVGSNTSWAIDRTAYKDNMLNKVTGPGYLFVFVDGLMMKTDTWSDNPGVKRRRVRCKSIFVCQASLDVVTWTQIPTTGIKDPRSLKWSN